MDNKLEQSEEGEKLTKVTILEDNKSIYKS